MPKTRNNVGLSTKSESELWDKMSNVDLRLLVCN